MQKINNKSLKNIRMKILFIYLFNLTDIFFTLVFQRTGYFIELNPIMNSVIQNEIGAITLKCLLPAVLLAFLFIRMNKANEKQLLISNRIVSVVLMFYFIINVMHLISFIFYKSYGIM